MKKETPRAPLRRCSCGTEFAHVNGYKTGELCGRCLAQLGKVASVARKGA